MDAELIKLIKSSKVFASLELEDDILNALLIKFEDLTLEIDDFLFRQGESSDYFYILVSGKLLAFLADNAQHDRQIIGTIFPGETVGELGALSGEVRSLTVKAVEKSYLLKLTSTAFKDLCYQYPSILFGAVNSLIHRSQKVIQLLSAKNNQANVAILPANEHFLLDQFEQQLRKWAEPNKQLLILSENSFNADQGKNEESIHTLISEAEANNKHIIYILMPHETLLAKICLSKIKKLLILGDGETGPQFSNFTESQLRIQKNILGIRLELILLYANSLFPLKTTEWLSKASFHMHYNIRMDSSADFQRLLRFMVGAPIGLVLSGGGTKAWVHIGVLKALIEKNIPIDAIGGSSSGAVVAAMYAFTGNYEETYKKFEILFNALGNIVSLTKICWPTISLFTNKQLTQAGKELLGDIKIENLWVTYFCISCNINLFKEAVHHDGYLWEKTRATTSLPVIHPPMVLNGEIHVDGGLVNNFPINVMRDLLGFKSKIIGSELVSDVVDHHQYNFPPDLDLKEALLARCGYKDYQFPSFLDVFFKSLLIGSSAKQQENSAAADLLIAPDITTYSMLKYMKEEEKQKLIEMGYQAAIEKINSWNY